MSITQIYWAMMWVMTLWWGVGYSARGWGVLRRAAQTRKRPEDHREILQSVTKLGAAEDWTKLQV
eukprot:4590841-Amphidinium_carterae.1